MKVELVVETGWFESDALSLRTFLKEYNPNAEYSIRPNGDHILIRVDEEDFPAIQKYLRKNTFTVWDNPLDISPDVVLSDKISYC